jgi:hypothetical protein
MFESLQRIYLQLKSFLKYISYKMTVTSEEPHYQPLPEDDIQNIFL